jgi:hypothetical protein
MIPAKNTNDKISQRGQALWLRGKADARSLISVVLQTTWLLLLGEI